MVASSNSRYHNIGYPEPVEGHLGADVVNRPNVVRRPNSAISARDEDRILGREYMKKRGERQ